MKKYPNNSMENNKPPMPRGGFGFVPPHISESIQRTYDRKIKEIEDRIEHINLIIKNLDLNDPQDLSIQSTLKSTLSDLYKKLGEANIKSAAHKKAEQEIENVREQRKNSSLEKLSPADRKAFENQASGSKRMNFFASAPAENSVSQLASHDHDDQASDDQIKSQESSQLSRSPSR